MKVRAGIIGSENSVQRICEVSQDMKSKFNFIQLPYKKVDQTENIIKQNTHRVDLWIFTGIVPFMYAVNHSDQKLMFHCSIDHTSVQETMLNISYNYRMDLEKISFDTLQMDFISDIYLNLNLTTAQIFTVEIKNTLRDTDDIIRSHEELYYKRNVDCCVTSIKSVYDELLKKQIPVFRIMPSKHNIQETMNRAYLEYQTQHFKQTQIAIMHINLNQLEEITVDPPVTYEFYRSNLKVREKILNYSEVISGTYYPIDIGRYVIFSTRESFQTLGQMGKPLLEQIGSLTNTNIYIGIGYGDTALAANNKAALALYYAESHGSSCIFLGDESGTIEGPLEEDQSISFSFRTEDQEVIEKLKRCGVSVTSYNKILSVQEKTEDRSITASQFATWLHMTQRNARRILNALIKEGLAEIIGEEVPTSKGRPRKIYKVINFSQH